MSGIMDYPKNGRFGDFGGRYVPESLHGACVEVERYFEKFWSDEDFKAEYIHILQEYAGRPTPLTHAKRLSDQLSVDVFLKREDLTHTGSHKINNVIGQALLTKKMGKKKIIAETGAGQHGVATATAAALFGLSCQVYMGEVDVKRQALNVFRMQLLGAEVIPVGSGSRTLKDAVNEAMRAWVSEIETTHYCIGSVMGPHPYPYMVREFQRVIGEEAATQFANQQGGTPDFVIACIGGGSNAAGTFAGFVDTKAKLIGVEPEGGAAISRGSPGVVHGMRSNLLQDEFGQVQEAESISAGLDYPGVGPEHSYLASIGRASYKTVSDSEVLEAVTLLSQLEGIVPALEPAHAVAYLAREAGSEIPKDSTVVLTLSGRGDKDAEVVASLISARLGKK